MSLLEIQAQYRGNPLLREDGKGDACDACPASTVASCAPTTCLDRDGDGYGVPGASACSAGQPAAFDCNDARRDVHPGAVEACDSVDNDCDGVVDDSCLSSPKVTRYTYNGFNQLLTSGTPVTCAAGDSDCDGVADAADNCPASYNPGQEDSDRVTLEGTNPAAAWRFEDAAGSSTVADSTGRNTGTMVGGATFAPGRPGAGNALSLNGSSAYVQVPGAVSSPTNTGITIEAWVNNQATTFSFYRSIVSEVLGADGNVEFGLFTQGATHNLDGGSYGFPWRELTSTSAVPLNTWSHVAGTFDGSQIRLYRDGVKVAQSAPVAALPQGTSGWQIGAATAFGQSWKGFIDDVAIYDRALTDTEVAQHRSGGDGLGDACDSCANNPDPACHAATCTDADGDGFGPRGADNCGGNAGKFDCDDGNAAVRPGAAEVMGDSLDNNCDGVVDGGVGAATLFSWDGNGNQTKKAEPMGATTFTSDARDRLAAVAGPGGSATYGYDTGNLRVRMNEADGDRRILLDGIEEMAEYNVGGGSRAARWEHDVTRVDALLAHVAGSKTHFMTDALGSVYGLTDTAGAAVTRYSYDGFGARSAAVEAVATSWGFTGRRMETDATDRLYLRHRYYDSGFARFGSEDPVTWSQIEAGDPVVAPYVFNHGYVDSRVLAQVLLENRYNYVGGKPVNLVDPLGLYWMEFVDDHIGRHPYTLWVYGNNKGQYPVGVRGGGVAYGFSGTSGVTSSTTSQQCTTGLGPIPEGLYLVDPTEISRAGMFRRLANAFGYADWGTARVTLHPQSNACPARGGFFIHGGTTPGSAGCSDLGDLGVDTLFAIVAGFPGYIPLWVHYAK